LAGLFCDAAARPVPCARTVEKAVAQDDSLHRRRGKDTIFIAAHDARALADRSGRFVSELGALIGKLPGRRIKVEAFRLQNIAATAQPPSRGQQIAASFAMKTSIVGYTFENVDSIGRKRTELIDHDIRRGHFYRSPHRTRVESIGPERAGAEFAQAID